MQVAQIQRNSSANEIPTTLTYLNGTRCALSTDLALFDCCVSPSLEEAIYSVRDLATHRSVKPSFGHVSNKAIK